MGICFVIQPFDRNAFDKRYEGVFKPAITAAGLEAYRVDRDPSVSIPIDDIERNIKNADVVLADITTDNPNVWFELGFAIASQKAVVLVCSSQRTTKFPFDVQHRNIISYSTDSPQDFDELKQQITERIEAIIKKNVELGLLSSSPIADTKGLSQHEIVALVSIAQNLSHPDDKTSLNYIRQDMETSGFTRIAVTLALNGLLKKGMISFEEEFDHYNNSYSVYGIEVKGMDWLSNNQDKLVLRQDPKEKKDSVQTNPFEDDEVPF